MFEKAKRMLGIGQMDLTISEPVAVSAAGGTVPVRFTVTAKADCRIERFVFTVERVDTYTEQVWERGRDFDGDLQPDEPDQLETRQDERVTTLAEADFSAGDLPAGESREVQGQLVLGALGSYQTGFGGGGMVSFRTSVRAVVDGGADPSDSRPLQIIG